MTKDKKDTREKPKSYDAKQIKESNERLKAAARPLSKPSNKKFSLPKTGGSSTRKK